MPRFTLSFLSILGAAALAASAHGAEPAKAPPKPNAPQFGNQPGLLGGDMARGCRSRRSGQFAGGSSDEQSCVRGAPNRQGTVQGQFIGGTGDGQSIRRRQPNRRPRVMPRRRP